MRYTYICVLFLLGCHYTPKEIIHRETQITRKFPFDPICGDEVLWHVHLQDGFKDDSIFFTVAGDTFPTITNVKSNNNGCTNIYLTCYRKDGEFKIFLKNMPHFNLVKTVNVVETDSLNVGIIVDEKLYAFKESLDYYNFFGINYDSLGKNVSFLRSKECFNCW